MGTLLEHKETLLWLIVVLNLCLTVVIALYGSVSAVRTQQRSIRRRLDQLEEQLGDLSERFSRKQSRDAMRAARQQKEDERTLAEQAAEIVARTAEPGGPSSPVADKKTALRMRLKGSSGNLSR